MPSHVTCNKPRGFSTSRLILVQEAGLGPPEQKHMGQHTDITSILNIIIDISTIIDIIIVIIDTRTMSKIIVINNNMI